MMKLKDDNTCSRVKMIIRKKIENIDCQIYFDNLTIYFNLYWLMPTIEIITRSIFRRLSGLIFLIS